MLRQSVFYNAFRRLLSHVLCPPIIYFIIAITFYETLRKWFYNHLPQIEGAYSTYFNDQYHILNSYLAVRPSEVSHSSFLLRLS